MNEFEKLQIKALTSIAESQEKIVAELTDIKTILKDIRQEMGLIEGHQYAIRDTAIISRCLIEELEQCIVTHCNCRGGEYKSFRIVSVE